MRQQSSIQTFIEATVAENQIAIFSKTYCSYCHRTKALMRSDPMFQNLSVQIYELDTMKEGALIQDQLRKMTGQTTVPSVWVHGRFVGGNSETQKAYRSGELAAMLAIVA